MRQRLNRRTSDRKLGRALDECEARRSVVRALSEQRRAIQRVWGHLDLEARYARLSAVVEKLKVPKYGDASTTLGISMGLLNMQYALTVDDQVQRRMAAMGTGAVPPLVVAVALDGGCRLGLRHTMGQGRCPA